MHSGNKLQILVWAWHLTKHSRGIYNAWQFWFELALVFTAQWFRSGGLRCSPLNAALVE
ncbi:acetyltransferase [Vibrio parahaemolyticus]|nr:acetyltransferase [Vibrio parahaemolyticus]EGR5853386.1 acetyltransferase [Vibrio parahaemolyticus]